MSKFFSSMLPFEIILLIMGVIVFLALLFLLIWNDLKKEKILTLLPFFLIPVILVGYPSIQSVEFKDDGLSIQKYTQAVQANPADTASRNLLEEKLAQFKSNSRTQNNPKALTTIADAQLALGKLDSAALTVKQASLIAPRSNDVKQTSDEIKRHLAIRETFRENIGKLSHDLNKLQISPKDTNVTGDITQTLMNLDPHAYVDPASALVIAKAYAVMNQPTQSAAILNQILVVDSSSTEAKKMKADMVTGRGLKDRQATITQQNTFQKSAIHQTPPFRAILRVR